MKQAKKFLALLAAAALAMTLLAGCTVRPGPDGNVIIVPDDEEEYIPAPPVAGQPPEDIGAVTWQQGSMQYADTRVHSAQGELEKDVEKNETYCLVYRSANSETICVKYNNCGYTKMTEFEETSEALLYEGKAYRRDNASGKFRMNGEGDINKTIFAEVVPDLTELVGEAEWYQGYSNKGFHVESSQVSEGDATVVVYVYFRDQKYVGTDVMAYVGTELMETQSRRVEYNQEIPEEVKQILDNLTEYIEGEANPPIAPITPVN